MATALLPSFPPATPTHLSSSFQRSPVRRRGTSADAIVDYVAVGRLDAALAVLAKNCSGGAFVYNQAIRGCADAFLYEEAIHIYRAMLAAGVAADRFTFPFVAKCCGALQAYDEGRSAHCRALKMGLLADVYVGNAFIAMYAKTGCIGDAECVFDEMARRDRVSWNSMIDGYVTNGEPRMALLCFSQLHEALRVGHDRYGIMSALAACAMELASKEGKQIHCYVVRHGLDADVKVQTSLIDMYCKCGDVLYAERAFTAAAAVRNPATWNALIGGYAMNDEPAKAFACVREMQAGGVEMDAVTMVGVLAACASAQDALRGKEVHAAALRRGLLPHVVLETALLDMFGKCWEVESAQALFDRMPERTLVSWNAVIAAHAHTDRCREAVELFVELLFTGIAQPDIFTLSAVIPAYIELRSLRHSKQIHAYVLRSRHGGETLILNSVIYMYARSGDVAAAREVFDRLADKDVISWNTMIMAHGIHGDGDAALELFSRMKREGVRPNESTFVSVLTACSVSGCADEGWKQFSAMQEEYGMAPQVEHYGCMVDLLGRSGDAEAMLDFVEKVPFPPTGRIWGSVLTASRNSNDMGMAELAAEHVLELEHDNTGCYVLLAGMYADAGRWEDVERIERVMEERGLKRTEPTSTLELDTATCSFLNANTSHPKSRIIHEVSDLLSRKMGEAVSGGEASVPASRHCVRLAVVCGLVCSPIGTPIVVKKNVRVCSECHRAFKFISSYSGRKILVGDSRVYHHFCNGSCCCNDYW